jgi:hypothetical protein
MARQQGCGGQLLGALVLLGLSIWGIDSCVRRNSDARHAEVQRLASLTPDQRAEENRVEVELTAKAAVERQRTSRETDVRLASEEYVRRFLRFPDDADFGFWSIPDVKSNQAGDVFYVSSTVKAKNVFGAQLTYRWRTIIAFDGKILQLVACDIDGTRVYEDEKLAAKLERRTMSMPAPKTLDDHEEAAIDAERDAATESAKWRTWTSADGKYNLHAKFVKSAMGTLTLEKEDGSTVEVKLDRLRAEDQEFVRKRKWRLSESRNAGPAAKVARVRVVPFTTVSGVHTQMVLIDWRNTGRTTIRAVDADIIPYDAQGNRLELSGATDKPIYAVDDSSPGIAPGEKYTEPMGQGYILGWVGVAEAARVEVRITEVVESGAY